MSMLLLTRRASGFSNFQEYQLTFWDRHYYDMINKKPPFCFISNTHLHGSLVLQLERHVHQYLGNHVTNPEDLEDKVEEMDLIALQISQERVYVTEKEDAYIDRQKNLFVYKVLRDMHKEVFLPSENAYRCKIDRDGDSIMNGYVENIANMGTGISEADELGERLASLMR